jgi:hypothetical protein
MSERHFVADFVGRRSRLAQRQQKLARTGVDHDHFARCPAIEQVIIPALRDLTYKFKVRRALPSAQRRMVGPLVFLDHLGLVAFRGGSGLDILPHPHIGVSTLTYLLEGELIHRDTLGNVRAVRAGDVNWMTAGSGVVHLERSPAKAHSGTGCLFGQQIWVAFT